MSRTFHLTIASVGATLFDGEAESATFPGAAGEFTILPNHEALIATLKPGTARIKTSEGKKDFPLESGVVECSGKRVVVLV